MYICILKQQKKKHTMLLALFISIALNITLMVLTLHSRTSYHLIMKKNLQKEDMRDELVEKISYETTLQTDEQERRFLNNLKSAMEDDKVYLDAELNIQKLAVIVGTNKTTLSHIINNCLHQNFSTILNKYRIREAVKLLSDERMRNHKIEAIGEMCGYNNRQVFHAAFKKEMGITPTHFRRISTDLHPRRQKSSRANDGFQGLS